MIIPVNDSNIIDAANIYMLSWKESHKSICSKEFIEKHDLSYMKSLLQEKIREGGKIYLLQRKIPLGIVCVTAEDEICLLYVLPSEQHKGCGNALLEYAIKLCKDPWLTVLETNEKAIEFYKKRGFKFCGEINNILSKNKISEYKYVYQKENM